MSTSDTLTPAAEALGLELGTRTVAYREDDAILYALAVGARAGDLDLVFERDLRVLPSFGLTLGLWGTEALRERGFFSPANALHASQRLQVLEPLPPAGELELSARVAAVWDKGSAAIFEVEVACRFFRAVYATFAPGAGGWGGERGSSAGADPETEPCRRAAIETSREQAVLYRLTGDRHLIHVLPEAAAESVGRPRPIMHGLCTVATALRELAGLYGKHPCDLAEFECRFAAPTFPGDRLELRAWDDGGAEARFAVASPEAVAISAGTVLFA
jgi:acyl dehydratase